mgnify:CR=1 FL=1
MPFENVAIVFPSSTINVFERPGVSSRLSGIIFSFATSLSIINLYSSGYNTPLCFNLSHLFSLPPPIKFSLEEALEYIQADEYVEVTPKHIRLRKILLKEFERNTSYLVSFETITLDFYNRLQKYMIKDLDHSLNTFGKRIKTIKSIMNYATEIGVNKNLEYQKKSFKVLSVKTNRIYLTIKEINKLKELNLSGAQAKTRDAFVLMCYLGLRFSDYNKINHNNISNGFLDITMHKTGERVSIPIHPYALEIIKRYNYILPKISNLSSGTATLPTLGSIVAKG